jgi:hypothetical protein
MRIAWKRVILVWLYGKSESSTAPARCCGSTGHRARKPVYLVQDDAGVRLDEHAIHSGRATWKAPYHSITGYGGS